MEGLGSEIPVKQKLNDWGRIPNQGAWDFLVKGGNKNK